MASSELYEEIGRLKQRVDYLREEIIELKENNETLNEVTMAMHRALATARRALERDRIEKARLQQDVRWLNQHLQAQDEEIEKLHDQVNQAQRTIKVQSDQIAAPNEKVSRWTQSPHVALPSRPKDDSSRPTPAFNLPQIPISSTHPHQHLAQPSFLPPPPPAPSQSRANHEQHVPFSRLRTSDSEYLPKLPTQPANVPVLPPSPPSMSQSSSISSRYPPKTPQSLTQEVLNPQNHSHRATASSGILVETGQDEMVVVLPPDLSPLFFRGEEWARRHCGIPSKTGDAAMPRGLKDRIASLTNILEAPTLLSHSFSRPLVVAKLINYEITAVCLHPSVINGFRPSTDQKLAEIRAENQSGVPINVRRGILVAAAEIIQDATKNPRFEFWIERQVNEQTAKPW